MGAVHIADGDNLDTLLASIPLDRVREIHLGGHSKANDKLIDTHAESIGDEVWDLYQQFCSQYATIPTLIEWDNALPTFPTLLEEQQKAEAIMDSCSGYVQHAL